VSQKSPQRIGIYGGSFDPVHRAHIVLAQTALQTLPLDRVIFVPSGGIAHYKTDRQITPGKHRLAMIELAIAGNPCLQADPYEINRPEFTYTIQTLRHFRDQFPQGSTIYLLIGADWRYKLSTWKEGDALVREFNIALFSRPGFEAPSPAPTQTDDPFVYIPMPLLDLASSDIRERIQLGQPVETMLPAGVWPYIQSHGLYR
jgi:nicotinate-nucleotide adenylyltransferase